MSPGAAPFSTQSTSAANELEQRVAKVTEPVPEFIERCTGRPIGVHLRLPLREI
jgi:hypothetical protein